MAMEQGDFKVEGTHSGGDVGNGCPVLLLLLHTHTTHTLAQPPLSATHPDTREKHKEPFVSPQKLSFAPFFFSFRFKEPFPK